MYILLSACVSISLKKEKKEKKSSEWISKNIDFVPVDEGKLYVLLFYSISN